MFTLKSIDISVSPLLIGSPEALAPGLCLSVILMFPFEAAPVLHVDSVPKDRLFESSFKSEIVNVENEGV